MNGVVTKKIILKSILVNIGIPFIGLLILFGLGLLFIHDETVSKISGYGGAVSVIMMFRGVIITINLITSYRPNGLYVFLKRVFIFPVIDGQKWRSVFLIKRFVFYSILPAAIGFFAMQFRHIYRTQINLILSNSIPSREDWLSILLIVVYVILFIFAALMTIALLWNILFNRKTKYADEN